MWFRVYWFSLCCLVLCSCCFCSFLLAPFWESWKMNTSTETWSCNYLRLLVLKLGRAGPTKFPFSVMCWMLCLGCQRDTEVLHVSLRPGHLLRLGCCCHHKKMLLKWSTENTALFSCSLKCFFLFLIEYQTWLPLFQWLCISLVFKVLKFLKINLKVKESEVIPATVLS